MKPLTPFRRRRAEAGFAMLEALIGILIFSFGILGVVGLQASMTKAQTQSRYRANAAALAGDLVGTMWSDLTNLSQYDSSNCDSYEPCRTWAEKVAAVLPGGAPAVVVNGTSVTVTLSWTIPGEAVQARYVTATAIAN